MECIIFSSFDAFHENTKESSTNKMNQRGINHETDGIEEPTFFFNIFFPTGFHHAK
jgi:hypothetical protein